MENTYIKDVKRFCSDQESCSTESFLKKLFFLYPSKKIDSDILHEIIEKTCEEFDVPYQSIKVIGSTHLGFSFIDKNESGNIKYYDDSNKSDIDIAIVNTECFLNVHQKVVIDTKDFTDLTQFKTPSLKRYYEKNHLHGFIRPDSVGSIDECEKWESFFTDLSEDYGLNISGALYLNETSFLNRLNKQLAKFKEIEEVKNGFE